MKVLLVLPLLLVCINALENILPYLCYKPVGGPPCQKLKTYYWSAQEKKCLLARYLRKPCGFFYDETRCNTICKREKMSFVDAEEFLKTIG